MTLVRAFILKMISFLCTGFSIIFFIFLAANKFNFPLWDKDNKIKNKETRDFHFILWLCLVLLRAVAKRTKQLWTIVMMNSSLPYNL